MGLFGAVVSPTLIDMWNPILYPVQEDSGITLIGDQIKLKSLLKLKRSPSQATPYTFTFPANPGSDNQALFWSGTETTFRGIAIADVANLQTNLDDINTTIANLDSTYASLIHDHAGTNGDSFIINLDKTDTGSDRSITFARPSSQSASYSLILPASLGTANQGLIIESVSGSSANLVWGNSGGGFSSVASYSTASVNINLANGNMVAIALTQNTTIATITGIPSSSQGAEFTLLATQDAVGGRTLSFPSGTTITGSISSDANSTSVIKVFSFNSGNTWEAIVIKPLPNATTTTEIWTPGQISPLVWLDASDTTTTLIGSGISQWNSKTTSGMNLTQSTASSQPALIFNGLNDLNTIRFDGVDDVLNFSTTISNIRFVFMLCKWLNTTNIAPILGGNPEYDFHCDYDNPNHIFGGYTSSFLLNGTHYVNEVPVAASAILKNTNWTLYCFSATNNVRVGNVGSDRYISGRYANLEVAEIVMMSISATTEVRQKIAGSIAYRRGLQSLLPTDHPYKTSPPLA